MRFKKNPTPENVDDDNDDKNGLSHDDDDDSPTFHLEQQPPPNNHFSLTKESEEEDKEDLIIQVEKFRLFRTNFDMCEIELQLHHDHENHENFTAS